MTKPWIYPATTMIGPATVTTGPVEPCCADAYMCPTFHSSLTIDGREIQRRSTFSEPEAQAAHAELLGIVREATKSLVRDLLTHPDHDRATTAAE